MSISANAWGLFAIGLLGYVLRLALWFVSDGSNDIRTWLMFARSIRGAGLEETYHTLPLFNHPPLMGWWSVAALAISDTNVLTFAQAFKLPSLAAECVTGALLIAAWRRRGQEGDAWRAFAAYGAALNCMLVSAHHGNTDAVYACLAFASMYLLEAGRAGSAGLALGAALNVKLIPVVLILPLASRCPRMGDVRRFLAGAALGAIPYLTALAVFAPDARMRFIANIFRYQSNREYWGVELAVRAMTRFGKYVSPALADLTQRAGNWYFVRGSTVLLLATAVLAAWHVWLRQERGRQLDAFQLGSLAFGSFLLIGSGFGVQYVMCIVAPLLAWRIRDGAVVAWTSGLFILAVYLRFAVNWLPFASSHGPIPGAFAPLGLLAWLTIAAACWRIVHGTTPVREAEPAAGAAVAQRE